MDGRGGKIPKRDLCYFLKDVSLLHLLFIVQRLSTLASIRYGFSSDMEHSEAGP